MALLSDSLGDYKIALLELVQQAQVLGMASKVPKLIEPRES